MLNSGCQGAFKFENYLKIYFVHTTVANHTTKNY